MLMLLVSVLTLGASFGDPIVAFALSNNYIVMTASLPSNTDMANGFAIPYDVYTAGWTANAVKIRVTMPNGVARTFNTAYTNPSADEYKNSDNKYFTIDTSAKTIRVANLVPGDYRIEYLSVTDGASVVTESHLVTVTQKVYTMELSDTIVPDVVNPDTAINLPSVTVYDEDGEEVDLTLPANSNISVTTSVTKATNGGDEEVTVSNNAFTPTTTGTYTTTITLKVDGLVIDDQEFTTEVKSTDDFDASKDVKLASPTFDFVFPTASEVYLNEEFSLPTATVKNSVTDKTASAKVTIKVKAPGSNDWVVVNGYKYTATTAGQYQFQYYFEDFYGNELGPVTQSLNVTDHKAPVVKMVKAYDKATATLENVVEDYVNLKTAQGIGSYTAKSEYTAADNDTVGIYFPAIYAYDETDGADVTLSRTFKYNGHTFDIDAYQAKVNGEVDHSKPVYFKFTTTEMNNANWVKSGAEYTVIYKATDNGTGATKTNSSTFQLNNAEPTIVLYTEDAFAGDVTAPTIGDFTLNNTEIYPTDTISFSMPTILDYKLNDQDSQVDTRVETHVMWFTGDATNVTASRDVDTNTIKFLRNTTDTNATELDVVKDNVSFNLPADFDAATNSQITIAIYAVDDYGNESVEYKTIKVINTNDSVGPVIVTDVTTAFTTIAGTTYESNATVSLPTVSFFDENSDNLAAAISVYDPNGERVNVVDGDYKPTLDATYSSKTGIRVDVEGFKFDTTIKGVYTVVYSAKDAGGNTKVVATTVTCNPVVIPTISGIGDAKVTMNLGETMSIPEAVVYADGSKVAGATTSFTITSDNRFTRDGSRFTPLETGVYTITYSASYNGKNAENVIKTITVVDTAAPVIKVNSAIKTTAKLNEKFYLPDFTVSEAGQIKTSGVKVTSSASTIEITPEYEIVGGKGFWTFTPTTNGAHTVVYYATDMNGNATAETDGVTRFTIQAGDVTRPTIVLNDGAVVRTGDTLKVDISKMDVTDVNYDNVTIDLDRDDIEIVLTHEGSSEVITGTKNGDITTFELDEVGKYTLSISIVDDANLKSNLKPMYFTVNAEGTEAGMSDDVLGSILIISSLVLLGGVIVYFIVTDKRAPKSKKK